MNSKENEKVWRIEWKILKTGETGKSKGVFTYDEAKRMADNLNRESGFEGMCIFHYPAKD